MDTKSTSFNGRLIVKIIAVILAFATVFFSAKSTVDDFLYVMNQNTIDDDYYFEGIFATEEEDIYNSDTFGRYMREYLLDLNNYVSRYGDGSKESYEKISKENEEKYVIYKNRLIENLYYYICQKESYRDTEFCLVDENIITLNLIEKRDTSQKDSIDLMDIDVISELIGLCRWENDKLSVSDFEENSAKAKKQNADLLITIPEIALEYYYDRDRTVLKAGTYALKVNEKLLRKYLQEEGFIGFYGTFEEYKTAIQEDAFNTGYKNINYIVTKEDGTVITNVENIPDEKDIAKNEFYLTGSDGRYTSNKGAVYYIDGSLFGVNGDYYISVERIPTQVIESQSVVHTTLPEATEPTTYEITVPTAYSYTPVAENFDLAVYFNDDAVFQGESLKQMKTNILEAGSFARKAILNVVIGLAVYLVALLLLMILSGRRSRDDDTVYLLPTDKIFIEFKLVISAALIWLAGCLGIVIIDEYPYMNYNFAKFCIVCLPVLVTFAFGILMEFIISITKKVKAKKFLNSFFVVWFIKVLCGNSFKVLKKIFVFLGKILKKLWSITGKFIKGFFALIALPVRKLKEALDSEKLYYAKNVEQTVKIKTAILIAANLPFAFLCFCAMFFFEGIDDFGELFLLGITGLPAMALDVLALIRGLSFVGGVSRIADVIKEYRKGNLDTPINRAGLPPYLIETGESLESLGEGIKIAVAEAVKQETTKTELITNISHDLKTPLTSIINYVDLLKKCDIQDETAVSYLEVLGEKSDRLKTLITDLVEASKAATGNIDVNFVNISLREILTQLVGEFSDAFSENNLDVILSVPDSDIIVSADNRLLYRVFENLAINIKKYSMPSTRVYISAEKKDGKGVVVFKNISNAPLNISPEELKQRFVRGDTSRATDGNGLGLSIAENLCTVQGGTLDIDIMGDLFIAKVELNCN